MSRIGKKPIALPSGCKVSVSGDQITVEAGSARLSMAKRPEITVKVEGDQVIVERPNDERKSKAMHGLTRALINNMITGVTQGFTRELEIVGVGWSARVQGQTVKLDVGYADTKEVPIVPGVTVAVEGNRLKISGASKQAVGEVAARIRATRKPEPYNGKGIKYSDEVISRKAGKAFAGGGA